MNQMDRFALYLSEQEKSPLTREKYCRDARSFLRWLGDRPVGKGETVAYKGWLAGRYAPASVNSMLSSVNAYLEFIGKGECRVKTLKVQREVFCSREKELSQGEYRRLLRSARGDRQLQLLMQTICSTGIRVSEHGAVTVEAARQERATVRSKGKTRTVFLPRRLCRELLAYAKSQGIQKGSIFLGKGGKPLDRSRIWAKMKKLCAGARVSAQKVFPHNLRHLFARVYYSSQKDIIRLADILGHSSVNTTRIYTRESGEVHKKQIERLHLLLIT